MTKTLTFVCVLLGLLLLAAPASAQSSRVVQFEKRHQTTWGESLYVLGDLPELGGGDATRALRMIWNADHRWKLAVELPAGVDYRFTYLVRDNAAQNLPSSSNARAVGSVESRRVPGAAVERRVKVSYYSGWGQVVLHHDGGAVALRRVGAGRGAGESRWEGEVRTKARELSFELRDGGAGVDKNPTGQRYRTRLSDLTLVDGAIHAGRPSPNAFEAKGRVFRVPAFRSTILGNQRDVYVYLPRGYDKTNKRYPVAYMHDGQNLFGPDAMFGGWRVAKALDAGIAAGRIKELIVVGPANTRARMTEYMPEADGGQAGRYGQFLTNELKPWADKNLRTLSGREHTATVGSSLGGLVSFYLGWTRSDVFGKVGSLSGSFWLRAFADNPGPTPRQVPKMWLDSGNRGGSRFDSMEDTLRVRDQLLGRGVPLGGLRHYVHYGASHNETYWRQRVGDVLEHLFPAE